MAGLEHWRAGRDDCRAEAPTLPWATGGTFLGELIEVVSYNACHLGRLVAVRHTPEARS